MYASALGPVDIGRIEQVVIGHPRSEARPRSGRAWMYAGHPSDRGPETCALPSREGGAKVTLGYPPPPEALRSVRGRGYPPPGTSTHHAGPGCRRNGPDRPFLKHGPRSPGHMRASGNHKPSARNESEGGHQAPPRWEAPDTLRCGTIGRSRGHAPEDSSQAGLIFLHHFTCVRPME
jgi:hypothetical protein